LNTMQTMYSSLFVERVCVQMHGGGYVETQIYRIGLYYELILCVSVPSGYHVTRFCMPPSIATMFVLVSKDEFVRMLCADGRSWICPVDLLLLAVYVFKIRLFQFVGLLCYSHLISIVSMHL